MRFRNLRPLIVLALLGTAIALAHADETTSRQQEEQAIRETSKAYLAALSKGDAPSLSSYWLPDGDIVDEFGRTTPAREFLVPQENAKPDGLRPEIKQNPSTIRFLTADVAIEDGTTEIMPAVPNTAPLRGRFTAMWVKQAGKWRLASVRESRAVAPAPGGRLADLEWLIGDWSGQHDDVTIQISARWNAGHTYLLRDLQVLKQGQAMFSGVQRIGWDPLTRRIKSWMFDSDGGHGEGAWHKEGDAWIVQAQGVLPDGRRTSSTNVYTLDGPDRVTWKSTGATTQGEAVPDLSVELSRQASTP